MVLHYHALFNLPHQRELFSEVLSAPRVRAHLPPAVFVAGVNFAYHVVHALDDLANNGEALPVQIFVVFQVDEELFSPRVLPAHGKRYGPSAIAQARRELLVLQPARHCIDARSVELRRPRLVLLLAPHPPLHHKILERAEEHRAVVIPHFHELEHAFHPLRRPAAHELEGEVARRGAVAVENVAADARLVGGVHRRVGGRAGGDVGLLLLPAQALPVRGAE
mmetsp:Transcript_8437/g.19834  ORF Transcript_8437/g.19834 Transcript_8437/m.19834 type:complete len:222 (-) Transcript_8437:103-768(-)